MLWGSLSWQVLNALRRGASQAGSQGEQAEGEVAVDVGQEVVLEDDGAAAGHEVAVGEQVMLRELRDADVVREAALVVEEVVVTRCGRPRC